MSAPLERDTVEITSEMIDAGRAELVASARDVVEGFANPSDVVEAIYRAMFLARPQE
jgi:hypothetical protein